MKIDGFIEAHWEEIDQAILIHNPHAMRAGVDDEERRLWVLNDEGLYNMAVQEGVHI